MPKPTDPRQSERPSPIPAWNHYDISKVAEEIIMAELESSFPDNLLAGLGIGYFFVPEGSEKPDPDSFERFCMSHGYWVDCENREIETDSEEEEESPDLDDDFIEELYEKVRALILENAPPEPPGMYMVSLEVTTAHFSKPKLNCKGQKCDWCSQHGRWHIFKKKRNQAKTACVWVCKNKNCGG